MGAAPCKQGGSCSGSSPLCALAASFAAEIAASCKQGGLCGGSTPLCALPHSFAAGMGAAAVLILLRAASRTARAAASSRTANAASRAATAPSRAATAASRAATARCCCSEAPRSAFCSVAPVQVFRHACTPFLTSSPKATVKAIDAANESIICALLSAHIVGLFAGIVLQGRRLASPPSESGGLAGWPWGGGGLGCCVAAYERRGSGLWLPRHANIGSGFSKLSSSTEGAGQNRIPLLLCIGRLSVLPALPPVSCFFLSY